MAHPKSRSLRFRVGILGTLQLRLRQALGTLPIRQARRVHSFSRQEHTVRTHGHAPAGRSRNPGHRANGPIKRAAGRRRLSSSRSPRAVVLRPRGPSVWKALRRDRPEIRVAARAFVRPPMECHTRREQRVRDRGNSSRLGVGVRRSTLNSRKAVGCRGISMVKDFATNLQVARLKAPPCGGARREG